jgi:hypothetical protein
MLFFLADNSLYLTSNTQEQIAAIIIVDAAVSILSRALRPLSAIAIFISNSTQRPRPIHWSLPDRYADIIKFFTVAAAFSFTAPAAFAVAALSIAAGRIFDAYDISRRWAVPPRTDYALAPIAAQFIAAAGLAHSWITLWTIQRWPFGPHTDSRKSPFAPTHTLHHDATTYTYFVFIALFIFIIIGDTIAHITRAATEYCCCGASQRRRPLSTKTYSRLLHGQYSPAPGALFQYNA